MQFPPDVDSSMPDAVEIMLKTRMVNDFLGSAYSLEYIAEKDDLFFDMIAAARQALFPPKKDK